MFMLFFAILAVMLIIAIVRVLAVPLLVLLLVAWVVGHFHHEDRLHREPHYRVERVSYR